MSVELQGLRLDLLRVNERLTEAEKRGKDAVAKALPPGTQNLIAIDKMLRAEAQLAKAEEMIRFYADRNNWDNDGIIWDGEIDPHYETGVRARAYFAAKEKQNG